jgi:hypothetical protein
VEVSVPVLGGYIVQVDSISDFYVGECPDFGVVCDDLEQVIHGVPGDRDELFLSVEEFDGADRRVSRHEHRLGSGVCDGDGTEAVVVHLGYCGSSKQQWVVGMPDGGNAHWSAAPPGGEKTQFLGIHSGIELNISFESLNICENKNQF